MAWALESRVFALRPGTREKYTVKNNGIFSNFLKSVLKSHEVKRQWNRSFVSNASMENPGGDSQKDLLVPLQQLVEARVVFCIESAMGHTQEAHPECNARVPAILEALDKAKLTPQFRHKEVIRLENISPATADDIVAVHSKSYVRGMEMAMEKAREEGLIYVEGSGPTYATSFTFSESLRAAGAGMALVDSVIAASKMKRKSPMGFALVRPPGHHAVPSGPMGFCIFGNIAIAARHAQRKHGVKKVLIIDFDVHHGNGTNDAFYDDPDIYFLSTHQLQEGALSIVGSDEPSSMSLQAGSYPGTGKIEDAGNGAGEGATLNLPLPGGSGDEAMSAVFHEVIVPVAQRFKPELILVSAGYDGHVLDPLAGLQFTNGTFYRLAANIKLLAGELCGGRCVFFLEGGYNLKSLSDSVSETFRAFLGEDSLASKLDNPAILYDEPSLVVRKAIDQIKSIHSL